MVLNKVMLFLILFNSLCFGSKAVASSWQVGVEYERAYINPDESSFKETFSGSLSFSTGYEYNIKLLGISGGLILSLCPCDFNYKDEVLVDYLGWGAYLGVNYKILEISKVSILTFLESRFNVSTATSHKSFSSDLDSLLGSDKVKSAEINRNLLTLQSGLDIRYTFYTPTEESPITRSTYIFNKLSFTLPLFNKVRAETESFSDMLESYDYSYGGYAFNLQVGVGFLF